MKTRELQSLWFEWMGTAEKLLKVLHEQTVAVTLRDVPRVERLQPELDSLLERVRTVDEQAVACAKKLAGELGTEPNLRSLVQVLEKAEAQSLQALANRITVTAQNVQDVIRKNQALMENEMTYINGTLTLIAKAAVEAPKPYKSKRGASVLVDTAA